MPVHADVQQTPCAHMPEPHSVPIEQNAPIGFGPHEPPVQNVPATQFASAVQASKQRLPLHANGAHASDVDAAQEPVASQVASGVNTPALQRSGAQTVPTRKRRQPLAPSHLPSVPQVDGSCAAHCLRGSSPPAGTGVQTPDDDGRLQLLQVPSQALSQHTPSTQKLLRHSLAAPQMSPIGFLPQLPLTHALPETQSMSLVHALMHAPSAQRYGPQFLRPGVPQLPLPSHVAAVFSLSLLHDAATHTVVCAA